MSKTLLITGATGRQGGAVIDALLASPNPDFTILAVTRDTSSAAAKRLGSKSPSIRLIQGDLDDIPALFRSALKESPNKDIWGVYSVQVSMGTNVTVESEIAQGKNMVDAALEHGVSHFVYSSVERGGDEASWDNTTPIPHFQTKYHIEQHLRDRAGEARPSTSRPPGKMGWTILRPVAFMDNLVPGFPTKVFLAAMRNYIGQDGKKVQWVYTGDIGRFAAKAFNAPAEWDGRAMGIAGDELTFDELSRAFGRATGSPAPVTYGLLGSVLTYAVKEVGLMIGWFGSDGYRADVEACRAECKEMLDMETWLSTKSGWAAT